MEKIFTVVINFICFILMIVMVNNYADSFIAIALAMFVIFLCYLLFKFRKTYISKKVLLIHLSGIFIQMILVYLADVFKLWKASNGFMGLGAGPFGTLLYFSIIILFFIVLLLINFFKYVIKKINNMKETNHIKKFITFIICILVVIIAVLLCLDFRTDSKEIYNENSKKEAEISEEDKIEQKVKNTLSNMALDEKIGQMIMVFYEDEKYTKELDNILNTVKPSGFVVFPKNITTYKDTKKYISKIKETADIPMLIGVDQEGGRVQRIKNLPDIDIQNIPPMLEIGKKENSELSFNTGKTLANQISQFGINTDFAPVLDIFSNPNNTVIGDRAFGTDAKTVIDMAFEFAKGMESEKIIPVYKHFPGHGDTEEDSHVKLPVVTKTKEQLYESELLPFKEAIKNNAQMIMVAHIALPNITGDLKPATLSKEIVDGILRKEMSYDGVVITDAINMKAIHDNYTLEDICINSINAGVDIILMPLDPIKTLNTIKTLVNDGTILEDRINESVSRILTLKYKNNIK